MLESKDFIFIVGSPRSGTTMLQILLASHPQVASTVEQTLYQHYLKDWLERWRSEVEVIEERGWKLGLPILWSEEELHEVLRDFLRRAYTKVLANKPAATHILDKHPGYSAHVATIKKFLPRAKFIHMIRDGRDVAASTLAAHQKMGFGPNDIPGAAEKWKCFLRAAQEASGFGEDYLEIRYEKFLEGKEETYAQVLEFCHLTSSPEWIRETLAANTFEKMKERGASPDPNTKLSDKRYHRGTAGGWRSDFSALDRYQFDRVAGDLLCELGYAQPGWWEKESTDGVLLPLRDAWWRRRPFVRDLIDDARRFLRGYR